MNQRQYINQIQQLYTYVRMRVRALLQQHQIRTITTTGSNTLASKPKVVQQESPEEIERKARELSQIEANENSAVRRKNKQSTALGSFIEGQTALSKTNTGT